MNRLDIIKQVKQSAINVMHDRKVLASVLIAESILLSESEKEIIANNPLKLRDYRNDMIIKFDSIEECYNFFIDTGIIDSSRSNIIGNLNYKSLVRNLRFDQVTTNSIIEIIESYKLNDIDTKVIQEMYDGKRTVVEIDTEPFIDCYRVREAFGSDRTEVLCTFDKDEAINTCKKYYGYSVFNSKGKAIFTNALTPELKAKMELNEKVVAVPKNGSKIYLNAVNLYESPDSKVPTRSITGFYYVSESKRYNNRYMITNKPEFVGDKNYIIGYINDSDRR